MATARDICTRALKRAHIVADGETPAGEQIESALELFLDLAEQWRDEGMDLGILASTEIDDTLLIDRGAFSALIWNLAVEVAEEQGAALRPFAVQRAERTRASLAARFMGTNDVRFDPSLVGLLGRPSFDIDAG